MICTTYLHAAPEFVCIRVLEGAATIEDGFDVCVAGPALESCGERMWSRCLWKNISLPTDIFCCTSGEDAAFTTVQTFWMAEDEYLPSGVVKRATFQHSFVRNASMTIGSISPISTM